MKAKIRNLISFIGGVIGIFSFTSCAEHKSQHNLMTEDRVVLGTKLDTATLATGCFWCTEAIFQRLKGVEKVISGYSGGHVANPTYEEVSSGATGHAESCQVIYDPQEITFDELLKV